MEQVYRAPAFDEAMARIKRELGPDALIVSAQQLARGGAGRGLVEVRAMSASAAHERGLDGHGAALGGALERTLRSHGVPPAMARSLARTAHALAPTAAPGSPHVLDALAQALSRQLVFGGPAGRGARVVALVGPTGVGKTTTIAKLAAHGALVHRRRIALVSLDQYRIGGAEQLQRYADLIEIPLEVAGDARSLEIALRKLDDAELVFLDTAGRSPRDPAALAEMAACFAGAQEPVEIHLCLTAATRGRELNQAIERYATLGPVRLTSTKLDEAADAGGIVHAHAETGLPLGYFTHGQQVPEDIRLATPEALAGLLMARDDAEVP